MTDVGGDFPISCCSLLVVDIALPAVDASQALLGHENCKTRMALLSYPEAIPMQ